MPTPYPFSRATPSSSSSSQPIERPVVVSASGRAPHPTSPSSNDNPSNLRSRISPNVHTTAASQAFRLAENERSSYPSPSALLAKGKSKLSRLNLSPRKQGKAAGGGGRENEINAPLTFNAVAPAGSNVPAPTANSTGRRYDLRGYPMRNGNGTPQKYGNGGSYDESPESIRSYRVNQLKSSGSSTSLSSISTTGAGVDGEIGRFLSPSKIGAVGGGEGRVAITASYPPVMSYSLGAKSYSPYAPLQDFTSSQGHGDNEFGQSKTSLNSYAYNGESMTGYRPYDKASAFSISSKGGRKNLNDLFSLPSDPSQWTALGPEDDDDLHDPDFRHKNSMRSIWNWRSVSNVGCLILMLITIIVLFAGYPIMSSYLTPVTSTLGAYNLGGVNASGQLADVGPFQLIDKDTPSSAYTMTSLETGDTWELVFSDEFNNDGRTFYDGDDPYWEAVDLHYWQTNNLEWYDPRAVTTKNGSLVITLSHQKTHGLNYQGGMISTWNRFCFTGGYIEASVSLPGTSNVYGLWPAIWTMGNLGRAGYGGSLDGMWPYSYDSCDVGTVKNQSINGLPAVTLTEGDPSYNNVLSYLPGQRLSSCTCQGDPNHPGPTLSNGSFVGRSAPEIDMFEATVDSTTLTGFVSQSGQWAPFNPNYAFVNTSTADYEIYDDTITSLNTYQGGVYQQATSALSQTDQDCYTGNTGCFSQYGFEYSPGGSGYITWVSNSRKAWTIRAPAMAPNPQAEIGQRIISPEPMYIIINLGLSENFGAIDFTGLSSLWPVEMHVDYIRVYQDPNNKNIGCDPTSYPTSAYITQLGEAYTNPNITVFDQVPGATKPKNRLVDTC